MRAQSFGRWPMCIAWLQAHDRNVNRLSVIAQRSTKTAFPWPLAKDSHAPNVNDRALSGNVRRPIAREVSGGKYWTQLSSTERLCVRRDRGANGNRPKLPQCRGAVAECYRGWTAIQPRRRRRGRADRIYQSYGHLGADHLARDFVQRHGELIA
jgi:hypothetical protein